MATTIAKPTPCLHGDTCALKHPAGKPRQRFAHDHFHTVLGRFPDVGEVLLWAFGKNRLPVFIAFAGSDDHAIHFKIDIFHPQPNTFHYA
jgi:hypothetical protein